MKTSRKLLCVALAFICAALSVCAQVFLLSPTVGLIIAQMEIKKCGVVNSPVQFSTSDFDKALGNGVEYVKVVSLPDSTQGVLTLHDVKVMENQTISRQNMDELCFVPVKDVQGSAHIAFEDSLNQNIACKCTVSILDEVNLSPETGEQTIETQQNIAAFKFLMAADPEGDSISFEVVSYPKNGSVSITENGSGAFEYIPQKGFMGRDSFSYIAEDIYGNASKPQTVHINVQRPAGDIYFHDMKKHWAHNSAVKMASTGLMSGVEADGELMFYPEEGMTRGDFLAVALITAGYESDIPFTETTAFSDDESIPANIKSYAEYAYDKGIINGYGNGDGTDEFRSTSAITRAEAAVIVDRLLSLPKAENSGEYDDASSIPDWASSSVASLSACGILNGTGEGDIASESLLTKGQAAEMICNVSQYLEEKERQQDSKKKGLFNLFGLLGN